jgi:hypothetical protein
MKTRESYLRRQSRRQRYSLRKCQGTFSLFDDQDRIALDCNRVSIDRIETMLEAADEFQRTSYWQGQPWLMIGKRHGPPPKHKRAR